VDRHQADADPYPTFHFDADPNPNLIPTPRFTQVAKSQHCQSTLKFVEKVSFSFTFG
jgi:hypothetical protein